VVRECRDCGLLGGDSVTMCPSCGGVMDKRQDLGGAEQ